MARRNPNTLDLTQQPLCLARDLRYWPIHQRGELVYRIEIPSLYRYFRVGYEEYLFLSLLDGQTTIPQACGLAAAQLGSRAPSAADATTICKWLLKNELAYLSTDVQPSRKSAKAVLVELQPPSGVGFGGSTRSGSKFHFPRRTYS